MKKLENKKGITLIALVITIIVLLILATVSISLVINNGILDKAKYAVDKYSDEQIKEEIGLIVQEMKMNQILNGESEEEALRSVLTSHDSNATVTKSNAVYEVSYMEKEFLLGSDLEYIERVDADIDEWTFNQSTQTLTAYNGNLTVKRGNQEIGEVIIPNYYNGKRVLAIANRVFLSKNISKLNISYGIETIGTAVFQNCKKLSGEVVVPNSVITMGSHVFASCSEINKVKLSNNLQKIPTYCFSYCTKLTGNIEIPESVTEVGGLAFDGCGLINSLTFLNKSVEIKDNNISSKVIIIGHSDSTAEAYATRRKLKFETLSE